MRLKLLTIVSLGLIISGSQSCRRDQYDIKVTGNKVPVGIKRLEQDLFTIDPARIEDSTAYLKEKYGSFLQYFSSVINIGDMGDSAWIEGLSAFSTDRLNNEVYGSVLSVFPDLEDLKSGLAEAFRRYRYYFPGKKVPGVYTFISGFNASIIAADSVLGIGLDRYLGAENTYYRRLQVYKYQAARMTPANIIPECFYGWASSEWNYPDMEYERENVLADIIHEGKLLYFVRCMLPETGDELIFGFNPDQVKFCRNNEGRMWQYLIENNLLFSSDQLTRKKLTGDAPFTSYFTSGSPGRAAAWIGFRIVESYMSRNRDKTLDDLMKEKDLQSILEKARYRPPAG